MNLTEMKQLEDNLHTSLISMSIMRKRLTIQLDRLQTEWNEKNRMHKNIQKQIFIAEGKVTQCRTKGERAKSTGVKKDSPIDTLLSSYSKLGPAEKADLIAKLKMMKEGLSR